MGAPSPWGEHGCCMLLGSDTYSEILLTWWLQGGAKTLRLRRTERCFLWPIFVNEGSLLPCLVLTWGSQFAGGMSQPGLPLLLALWSRTTKFVPRHLRPSCPHTLANLPHLLHLPDLLLPLALFPGFMIVLSKEEQGEMSLHHFVQSRNSQVYSNICMRLGLHSL